MSEETKTPPNPTRNHRRRRRRPRSDTAQTGAATQPSDSATTSNQASQGQPISQSQALTQGQPVAGPTQTNQGKTEGQPSRQRRNQPRRQNQRKRRSDPAAVPPVTAPPNRGRTKRPLAEPRIGVGCIVLRGDEVLLVRERGRWSLPKGGLEVGELVQTGARRETYEETGLIVELRDLAFIVEFQAETWGHHLQFFYVGREVGGTLEPRDPDRDVQEAKFVPVRQLREYLRFRPRLVALESWLKDRRPRHFVFDLDKEPAMLRKRRRVDLSRVQARRAASVGSEGELDDDLDEQP